MSTTQILIAGFGGQGILFAGKFLAYKGLIDGKNVSWLPSYGPEMRGGTASCSVILSDTPVGSPIVSNPDVLVAMNLPSLDRYEDSVVPGGTIYVDSTLIERKVRRSDVTSTISPQPALPPTINTPTLRQYDYCRENLERHAGLCRRKRNSSSEESRIRTSCRYA